MSSAPHERTRALLAAFAGAALVLFGASLADVFARHGWTASWYVERDGERLEMARSTEHRVVFPNEQRALARYIQRWDYARFGMPSSLPEIDATLRARLHVPEGGRVLGVRSPDTTRIEVDGRAYDERTTVPAGWHRVDVEWQARVRPQNALELQWGPSPATLEAVPRDALVPLEGSWPPLRVWLWLLSSIAALVVGWQCARIATSLGTVRAQRIGVLATAAILALGVGFRLFDYDVMPDFRENDDERFAIWNGYSLLEDGTTRGLTLWWQDYLAAGQGEIERPQYFDRNYHVVTPYFEHPPLLHALVGVAGHLGGARDHLEVPLAHARLVPILLCAITILLIVALGRRLDPRGPAPWLGALLWAALPWIAMQTRVVKEEALVAPLGIGMALAFVIWRERRRTKWLVLAAVLAGLAPLAKVTGVAFVLALMILVASEGRPRDFGVALLASLLTLSLLFVFGAVVDWDSFLFTQRLQSGRPVHWNIFLRFFDSPLINHSVIGRGWLLFLWLATMAGLAKRGRRDVAVIAVPLICYLAAIALGSGTWTFGWYVTPLLPFLCVAAGRFLADLWRAPDLWRGALFVFVLVFYSLNFVLDPEVAKDAANWTDIRRVITVALALSLAPFGLVQAFGNSAVGPLVRSWARSAVALGLAVVVVLGGLFVVRYETNALTYRDFDRDRYFDR
ncbi:ArnT family glycosyltransferase [Sandaracinus amylolyticus]|uniref:Glycosyl transferase family 39 n=1 Tax=Sandaracinus amylolyticus TaxID=927083 RepID=A0A0F6W2K9_9BACT|nr:glycosyltransferase family 39 protein [Sandaracinus amylolyticus]AKF05887.1 glycosyl transferase family 39 [Sandaracinus amylolyticus]